MRRTLPALLLTIALAGSAFTAAAAVARSAKNPPHPPNFVLFLADDLDQTTTPYWDVLPKTKRLLADRGLTFSDSFAPDPICCPARSTILTGKYPHNTGVLTNGGPNGGFGAFSAKGNEQHAVAVQLQRAGYRTALIGKYLNGYEEDSTHVPPGWTEWFGAADHSFYTGYNYKLNENGTLVAYGSAESDYSTDVVSRKAVDFIDRAAANPTQPFFLYLASTAPHLPLPAPPRYAKNAYVAASVPKPPNYMEPDVSDKPPWLRETAETRLLFAPRIEEDYRNRMGSLLGFDDMVAAVVRQLDATGELANTYLVFASDNGYNLGAHRLIHKMVPYEESVRVPLVVAGPKVPHRTTSAMVTQADYAPTWLELAGLRVPADVDGASLAPFLRGKQPKRWRTDVPVQYESRGALEGVGSDLAPHDYYRTAVIGTAQEIPTYHAIRTRRYLYVEWLVPDANNQNEVVPELYDLREDRYELQNLLADPVSAKRSASTVAKLQRRMRILMSCKGRSCRP